MKINYYVNQEKELVVGVANYMDEMKFVNGFSNSFYVLARMMCTKQEGKILDDNSKIIAFAKVNGSDVFDENVGKELVRAKILARDAKRNYKKAQIIEKYIVKANNEACECKTKAFKRLERKQGELETLLEEYGS